jgi:hypothetical protein
MLWLSVPQQDAVSRAIRPLSEPEQRAFPASLSRLLANRTAELGDGELFRLLRELQAANFRPPAMATNHGASDTSKTSRGYVR